MRQPVVGHFLLREPAQAIGVIADQRARQDCQVARARLVPGLGQPGGVHETGARHAQPPGFGVHARDERRLAAIHRLHQREHGVGCRNHQHGLDQAVDARGIPRLEEDARTVGLGGRVRHCHRLGKREFVLLQVAQQHIGRHQLGERCGGERQVGLAACQFASADLVDYHPGTRLHAGRRGGRSQRKRRNEEHKPQPECFHGVPSGVQSRRTSTAFRSRRSRTRALSVWAASSLG